MERLLHSKLIILKRINTHLHSFTCGIPFKNQGVGVLNLYLEKKSLLVQHERHTETSRCPPSKGDYTQRNQTKDIGNNS